MINNKNFILKKVYTTVVSRLCSKNPFVWKKSLEMSVMWLVNTVLVYKKGSKSKMNIAYFKNIMSQLSNALSIVFISLKLVEILLIEVFSVAPAKGPSAR